MRGNDYFRQKIQELELKAPPEKSNFYREYTKFLIEKMKTVQYLDSEAKAQDINVFFANPERAIAKMKEDRNFKLPLISISIDDIDEDIDRRKTSSNLEINTVWDVKKRRATRIISKASKPINISFTINVWSKYIEDINQIIESIMLMFNPTLDFKTIDSTNTKAFIQQITDNSTMSAGDQKDRVIRKMIIVTAEAYLTNPKYLITSTGEIERMGVDFEFTDNPNSNYQTVLALGADSAAARIDDINSQYTDPRVTQGTLAVSAIMNQEVKLSDGFTMLYNMFVPVYKPEFGGKVPLIIHTPGTGQWRNAADLIPSTGFIRSAGEGSWPSNPRALYSVERLLAAGYAVATYDVRGQSSFILEKWLSQGLADEGGGANDSSLFHPANLISNPEDPFGPKIPWREFGAENFAVRELLDVFEFKDHLVSGLNLPWTGEIQQDAVGHIGTSLGGMAGGAGAAWSGKTVPWHGISESQNEFKDAGAGEYGFPIDWGYTSDSVFSTFQAVSIGSFIADSRVFQPGDPGSRFGYLTGPIRMLHITTTAPRHLAPFEAGMRNDNIDDFVTNFNRRAPTTVEMQNTTVPVTAHFSYDDRQRGIDMALDALKDYKGPKFFIGGTSHHNAPKNYHVENLYEDTSIAWFNRYVKGEATALDSLPTDKDYYFMETPYEVSSFHNYDHVRAFHEADSDTLHPSTHTPFVLSRDYTEGRNVLIQAEPQTIVNEPDNDVYIDFTPSDPAINYDPPVTSTSVFIDIIKERKEGGYPSVTSTQLIKGLWDEISHTEYFSDPLESDYLFLGEVSAYCTFENDKPGNFGFDLLDKTPGVFPGSDGVRVVTTGSQGYESASQLGQRLIKSRFQCYKFKAGHRIGFRLKNHTYYGVTPDPNMDDYLGVGALRKFETGRSFEICPYFTASRFTFDVHDGMTYIKLPLVPKVTPPISL